MMTFIKNAKKNLTGFCVELTYLKKRDWEGMLSKFVHTVRKALLLLGTE